MKKEGIDIDVDIEDDSVVSDRVRYQSCSSPRLLSNSLCRGVIACRPLLLRQDVFAKSRSDELQRSREVNVDSISDFSIKRNLKILVLGNAKCGKSSLISRYCHNTFSEKYKTTIGADFVRKDIAYRPSSGAESIGIRLQLWDIAGQDRFQKLTRAYFSKAKGVVIVCDINRDGTIDAVRQWKREVTSWATQSGFADMPVVLFANKSDKMDKSNPRETFELGALMERLCREENFAGWYITSALTGHGVNDGFVALVHKIMEETHLHNDSDSRNSMLSERPKNLENENSPDRNSSNVSDSSHSNTSFVLTNHTKKENVNWGCYG